MGEAISTGFPFLDPGVRSDGIVRLELIETIAAESSKNRAPCYSFRICTAEGRQPAGSIRLRIGDSDDLRLYAGNIGYNVDPLHRGQHFGAHAVRLVCELAQRHGMTELWITCDPENLASRRTCELAGAIFVETVDLPSDIDMYLDGERQKCRYRLLL